MPPRSPELSAAVSSGRLAGGLAGTLGVQLGLAGLAVAVGLPERMAIHWGPSGQADGFASPAVALSFSPALTLVIGILLVFAPRLDPRVRADADTSRTYDQIVLGFLAFFTVVHAHVVFQFDVGRILPVLIGLGAILLGRSMRSIRPNGIMGVRTPWTLASDRAWERAHATLATWWTWGGAGTVVASLVHPAVGFGVLLVALLGSTLGLAVQSRRWWQDDPDRRPI